MIMFKIRYLFRLCTELCVKLSREVKRSIRKINASDILPDDVRLSIFLCLRFSLILAKAAALHQRSDNAHDMMIYDTCAACNPEEATI